MWIRFCIYFIIVFWSAFVLYCVYRIYRAELEIDGAMAPPEPIHGSSNIIVYNGDDKEVVRISDVIRFLNRFSDKTSMRMRYIFVSEESIDVELVPDCENVYRGVYIRVSYTTVPIVEVVISYSFGRDGDRVKGNISRMSDAIMGVVRWIHDEQDGVVMGYEGCKVRFSRLDCITSASGCEDGYLDRNEWQQIASCDDAFEDLGCRLEK